MNDDHGPWSARTCARVPTSTRRPARTSLDKKHRLTGANRSPLSRIPVKTPSARCRFLLLRTFPYPSLHGAICRVSESIPLGPRRQFRVRWTRGRGGQPCIGFRPRDQRGCRGLARDDATRGEAGLVRLLLAGEATHNMENTSNEEQSRRSARGLYDVRSKPRRTCSATARAATSWAEPPAADAATPASSGARSGRRQRSGRARWSERDWRTDITWDTGAPPRSNPLSWRPGTCSVSRMCRPTRLGRREEVRVRILWAGFAA